MSTNKEKIIQFIKKETANGLSENLYSFEKCNALIISMELFLDRSNVSRTLNELHRAGILIKKSGRPTTYLSKEILSHTFPFASFPDTLEKNEDIENYLNQPILSRQSATKSLSIIGSQKNGSLHELVNQALPVFYLPEKFFKMLILKGNFGTGKKYFLKKLLERAKNMQQAEKTAEVYFMEYQKPFENFSEILTQIQEQKDVYLFNIDMTIHTPTSKELLSFLQSLELLYENKAHSPIFALTIPSDYDPETLASVTPMILNFPDLFERPEIEIVQLTLSMIQQEAVRLSKNISVTADFLRALCSNSRNCHHLKQEIVYAVSQSLFSSYQQGELHALYLETSHLSESCRQLSKSADSYIFRHFPETVTLSFSEPADFSSDLSQFQTAFTDQDLPDIGLSDYFIRSFTLCDTKYPSDSTGSFSKDFLVSSFKQLFQKTLFSSDPILLDALCIHIASVLKGDFPVKKMPLPETLPDSPFPVKIRTIAESQNLSLSNRQKNYLAVLLHYCENLLSGIPIPAIVVSRHSLTTRNYIHLFNLHYNRRWLYFFKVPTKFSKEQQTIWLNELYQFALKCNRGQGVLILSDHEMKNTISNYLFPKTKLITYCIPLHSFLIFKEIGELMSDHPSSIFSVIPNLLICQQKELSVLKDHHLTSYTLRAADQNLLFAGKLMPGLPAIRYGEYFYKVLKQITKKLEIEITNHRILNFLFHGNCILFQRKYQMNFYEQFENRTFPTDPDLMEILKTCIEMTCELKEFQFTETEYLVLYEALVYSTISV